MPRFTGTVQGQIGYGQGWPFRRKRNVPSAKIPHRSAFVHFQESLASPANVGFPRLIHREIPDAGLAHRPLITRRPVHNARVMTSSSEFFDLVSLVHGVGIHTTASFHQLWKVAHTFGLDAFSIVEVIVDVSGNQYDIHNETTVGAMLVTKGSVGPCLVQKNIQSGVFGMKTCAGDPQTRTCQPTKTFQTLDGCGKIRQYRNEVGRPFYQLRDDRTFTNPRKANGSPPDILISHVPGSVAKVPIMAFTLASSGTPTREAFD